MILNNMKKLYSIAGLLLAGVAVSQTFTEVKNQPFKSFIYSAAVAEDFNNDGYPDVFFTGAVDTDGDIDVDTTYNEYYKNSGGNFFTQQRFVGDAVHLSDVKAVDFDNDGLLDVVTTGLSYNDIVNYKQYRFRNTGQQFQKIEEKPGKIYGNLDVFDFNHDGRQDYILNGTQNLGGGFTFTTDLYLNSPSGFTEKIGWMPGVQNGVFKTADFNNDGEYDAVLVGYGKDQEDIFNIYLNKAQVLDISQKFPPLGDADVETADFNGDGFLDFVVSGTTAEGESVIKYYRNDGAGKFTDKPLIEVPGSAHIKVGDLNNDGYYDIAVIGNSEDYDGVVKIYNYDKGSDDFVEAKSPGLYQLGSSGTILLKDFGNDDQLDVLINGFDWADPDLAPRTFIYKNDTTTKNTKPVPPNVLNTKVEADNVKFSWSGASDSATPVPALQYEISVGSAPGKYDLAKYLVTAPGWYLKKSALPSKFYWSVKSIDASDSYSVASTEKMVENILEVGNAASEAAFSVFPNPATDFITVKTNSEIKNVSLYDMTGRMMTVSTYGNKINVSNLPKGAYSAVITLKNGKIYNKKFLKN